MIQNKLRVGNFTSSEIVALTTEGRAKGTWGKPALTYIEETNYERRLGRSITDESNARALTWGKLLEPVPFELLGTEYEITSQQTDVHPTIPYWAGSKDGIKHDEGKTVLDFKCPLTLKSFCNLVQPLYDGYEGLEAMNIIREKHKDGDKFYWQLVSNGIINNCRYAELVVYVPYKSELPAIKLMADGQPNCYWVAMAGEDELPYLVDDGYYKNLNIIRFEIPQGDKDFLTEKVEAAGKLLINQSSAFIAEHKSELGATIIEKLKLTKIK